MGVDGPSAAFAEQTYRLPEATGHVVSRREYEALRDTAVADHELMQSRLDNQKAIIDRLQAENLRLKGLEPR